MEIKNIGSMFAASKQELQQLYEFRSNPEKRTKSLLVLVTLFLTPITLAGSLMGFTRAYKRFMFHKNELADFYPMRPIVRIAMVSGAIIVWLFIALLLWIVVTFIPTDWLRGGAILYYLGANAVIGGFVYLIFRKWQIGINNHIAEMGKFGTARFARPDELMPYWNKKGFYIGGGHTFDDKGHILTVAGTRGGKGVNLIIPNLLGVGGYEGSWVVIDPKGENAAITARRQRELGKEVIILNPWGLLPGVVDAGQCYNPLDILTVESGPNLVDDAMMIAEMIVPIDKNDKDKFFTDNARSIVTGLLVHLVCSQPKEERTLKTLWEWARLPEEDWDKLIEDMQVSDHETNGDIIVQCGNEIEKLMATGDRCWGTIIAVVLQSTDFMKSPAMQASTACGYDPKELSNGKTAIYIIIPADKLQTHARWLRLVTTTTMRAVVRNPNKRVCFLLDEFSALGYLPEIETALSTYAGYEITVWPILQSLIQLKAHYSNTWETFVGNSTIRQFFSVNDNFTADYVSKAIGNTSNVLVERSWTGIEKSESNSRPLVTSDELRRASGTHIFAFMGDRPVTFYPKMPYYQMGLKNGSGNAFYDDNPYYKEK